MIKKFLRLPISLLLVVLLLSFTAAPALAFDARSGVNITIASGEVVNSDLYLGGTNITIDGTVNGDVFAVAQTIRINGTINGGVTLAAQDITINGNVSAGVRVAGQSVSVGGNIGRDLIVASSDLTVNNSAVIGRDLNSYSSTTVMNGRVTGNFTGSIARLTIAGGVNGNVIVTVNTLLITSTASIRGNVNYTSDNTATIQPGSTISGTTSRTPPPQIQPYRGIVGGILGGFLARIFGFLSIFIIGLILLFAARRQIIALALTISDNPVSCLGWGALLFFITPIAAAIVMVTIIGIPLGLISLVVWGILLYLSQIPVALIVGWLILSRRRDYPSYGFLVGALALGLFILYAVSAVPIFGWIMWLFVMIFGLGSLIAVFRTRRRIPVTTPAP